MSGLVDFLSLSNLFELCSDHFLGRLCQPRGIGKDPVVWVDGARPLQKYIFKKNEFDEFENLTNLDPMKISKSYTKYPLQLRLFGLKGLIWNYQKIQ